MGQINPTLPVAGSTLNSIADPEIVTALQAIITLLNGNIDSTNLVPGAHALTPLATTTSVGAASGQQINAIASSAITVTLPAASLGAIVGVVATGATSATNLVTVAASGGATIFGYGLNGAASLPLGTIGAHVILQSLDGTNWHVIAGQRDTGWVAVTGLPTGMAAGTGNNAPTARLQGDTVRLRGQITYTGAPSSAQIFVVPASCKPASAGRTLVLGQDRIAPITVTLDGAGAANLSNGSLGTNSTSSFLGLDGGSYAIN